MPVTCALEPLCALQLSTYIIEEHGVYFFQRRLKETALKPQHICLGAQSRVLNTDACLKCVIITTY